MPLEKKRKTNDDGKNDDPLQSIITEMETADEDMKVSDLARMMADYFKKYEEVHTKISNLERHATVVDGKIANLEAKNVTLQNSATENADCLEVLQHDVKVVQESSDRNEMILHQLEQRDRDNDVFMTGFPSLPDAEAVLKEMSVIYNIEPTTVSETFAYEYTMEKSKKKSYHMIISFRDSSAKKKFMMKKKELGPLKLEQIKMQTKDKKKDDKKKNDTILCTHRLSKFNLKVCHVLSRAKADEKIEMFQLHNGVYRLKEEKDGPWRIIGTEESLTPYRPKLPTNPEHENINEN